MALLVYDVRVKDPVSVLQRWMKEFTSCGGSTENCLVIVAANKRDLAPTVDCTDAKIWAQSRGYKFIESSAATSEGIQGIFKLIHIVCMVLNFKFKFQVSNFKFQISCFNF